MDTVAKNSQHRLLASLFFICEVVFVASFAAIMVEYFHAPSSKPSMMPVFAFWISLPALLLVCFILRRKARRLAKIGWTTALILVFVGLMIPRL